jgi:hypothetical protein
MQNIKSLHARMAGSWEGKADCCKLNHDGHRIPGLWCLCLALAGGGRLCFGVFYATQLCMRQGAGHKGGSRPLLSTEHATITPLQCSQFPGNTSMILSRTWASWNTRKRNTQRTQGYATLNLVCGLALTGELQVTHQGCLACRWTLANQESPARTQ